MKMNDMKTKTNVFFELCHCSSRGAISSVIEGMFSYLLKPSFIFGQVLRIAKSDY
jgi:hypothetical protein